MAAVPDTAVATGVSRAAADPSLLGEGTFGLITNLTATMPDLARTIDALVAAAPRVVALFTPEHGLTGSVQAGTSEGPGRDAATGLPVYDTYLAGPDGIDRMVGESGAETLVFDLQDLGVRCYTYVQTMFDCLLSAARTGRRFVVLDRPNPLGGEVVAGPVVQPGYESFVGRARIPLRHGLTVGELAIWLNAELVPAVVGKPADLSVVAAEGWRRWMWFDQTGLPWVPLSPNLPTLDTATVYAGTVLFEATTLSEGRGTTSPFELVGAPYVDGRWSARLRSERLPGVLFREVSFVPSFHKYAGQVCHGVQLHVSDRAAFDPVRTALLMMEQLRDLYPEFVVLAAEKGADPLEPPSALDRLWGSPSLRLALESGAGLAELVPAPTVPAEAYPRLALLYS